MLNLSKFKNLCRLADLQLASLIEAGDAVEMVSEYGVESSLLARLRPDEVANGMRQSSRSAQPRFAPSRFRATQHCSNASATF